MLLSSVALFICSLFICLILLTTNIVAAVTDDDTPTPIAAITHNPTPNALLPTAFKTSTPTNKATKKPTVKPSRNDDDDDDDDDSSSNITFEPTRSPTMNEIEDADAGDVSINNYSFTNISFISIFLALVLIFVGFYYYYRNYKPSKTTTGNSDINDKDISFHEITSFVANDKFTRNISEETSLLKNTDELEERYTNSTNNYKTSPVITTASLPPQQSRIYFRATDLDGIDQFAGLMSRFIPIISNGIVCNLHTTKGPKPILLSLVGYEVRWQAIKSAQKRYKLHLRDVLSVEVGKQTRYHFIHFTFIIIYNLHLIKFSNFIKSRTATDNLCLSLVTQKTTLDLEVNTNIERDSLVKGFQLTIINLRNTVV
jgi:hypothetical protein